MKLCVSAEMPTGWLEKAQQIKFNDTNLHSVGKMPKDKEYIYNPGAQGLFKEQIVDLVNSLKSNLIICASTMEQALYCKENDIRFYFKHYITSYDELNTVIALGAEYALVGAPLFFEMKNLKRFNIKIRAIPNLAYFDGYIRENGVLGTWIRPEDLELYDKYVDTIEFFAETANKEELLAQIYLEKKEWLGAMSNIIHNFGNVNAFNNMFDEDVAKRRLNCGQRCQRTGTCHSCYWALNLADPEKLKHYDKELS